jgi:membrane-associated protease RseP (regulator of RpoE activity)
MSSLPPEGAPPGRTSEAADLPGQRGAAGALVRLGLVVLAGIALAIALHGVNVLMVVLAIVAMIMLHELGHLVTAKASGMKVTEYFLGFGPRLWSVRRGETEYGVKALPAGGYVKIVGMTMLEEVDPADEARSYRQATFPRRIIVAVAGSAVHMLLAVVLCWSFFVFVGPLVKTNPYVLSLVTFEHQRSPAEKAGLRPGDLFVSIDGKKTTAYSVLESEVGSHIGKPLDAVVDRHGKLLHLRLTPVSDQSVVESYGGQVVRPASKKATGIIGVELTSGRNETVSPLTSVPRAFEQFGSLAAATWTGITRVFSFHGLDNFAHSVVAAGRHHSSATSGGSSSGAGSQQTSITSILGVIQIGSQAASSDPGGLLLLLAEVNLFVGFVNLFPMLPLDGGHVLIAVYERLRSRRGRRYHADVLKLMPVAYVFLAFIVVLGLGALYANIVQPVHLPGG